MKKKLLKISKNIIFNPALLVIALLIIPLIVLGAAEPFTRAVGEVADVIQDVAIVAGIIAIAIAAIMFITAGGDEQRVGTAKQALIYGIIGIAIAGGAAAISNWAEKLIN